MILFWVLAGLMLLAALAFVLAPLLASRDTSAPAAQAVNVALYRERLAELAADREAGTLSEAAFEQARRELDRALLQDAQDAPPAAAPPRRGRRAAAAGALALPVLALALYNHLAPPHLRAHLQGGPDAAPVQAEGTLPSIPEMVARLEARLREQPEDARGWLMLGRSYMVMQRYDRAVGAYERARALSGEEPDLLAEYAEALGRAQGGDMRGEPAALAERVLELSPGHQKALFLAGIGAFQDGQAGRAVAYWEKLLGQLEADSEGAAVVRSYIARAGAEPTVPAQTNQGTASAGPVVVQARVSLAPELRARVAPDATVFVFARAVDGPPMPLAVARHRVQDLPLTVRLDDSMAMTPGAKLSGFERVYVGARISPSGEATPRPGDLQGRSAPIEPGSAAPVEVVIDQEIL